MSELNSPQFRVLVGVVLAVASALAFYTSRRPIEQQSHLGLLLVAGFLTGFLYTPQVVAAALVLTFLFALASLGPMLFGKLEELLPGNQGAAPSSQPRLPAALLRDLRQALEENDTDAAKETLDWWEKRHE